MLLPAVMSNCRWLAVTAGEHIVAAGVGGHVVASSGLQAMGGVSEVGYRRWWWVVGVEERRRRRRREVDVGREKEKKKGEIVISDIKY